MPDLHVVCRDIEEGKKWFFKLHEKIYEEMRKLGRDYVSLYNITSREFFENHKEFLLDLVRYEGKPVLICFYPEGINYYWTLNIEYHIIDKMKRPREIGTVQIDIGNAKRFGIKYVDKENEQKYPVILHTAIIGTIERYIYTIFDTVLREKNPTLPLWLSPVQVRLCPVNDSIVEDCEKVAEKLSKNNIRVDIDDRSESIQRKIRDAEKEWIPYIVVFGEREKESGKLSVRSRRTGEISEMSVEELSEVIRKEVEGYPYKPLPLPRLISKRPVFVG